MSILNFASGGGVASVTVSSLRPVAANGENDGGGGPMSGGGWKSLGGPGSGGGWSDGGGWSQWHGGGRQLWANAEGAPTSTARVASADVRIAKRFLMPEASRSAAPLRGDIHHRHRVIARTEEAPASRRGLSDLSGCRGEMDHPKGPGSRPIQHIPFPAAMRDAVCRGGARAA